MSDLIERLEKTAKYIRSWGVHDLRVGTTAGDLDEAAAALRSAAAREAALVEALEKIEQVGRGEYMPEVARTMLRGCSVEASEAIAADKGDAQPPNAKEPPPAGARGMNLE
jgi:hypothetical protein